MTPPLDTGTDSRPAEGDLPAHREVRWLLENRTNLTAHNVDNLIRRYDAEVAKRMLQKAERLHLDLIYVGPGSILDDPWTMLLRDSEATR